MFPNKQIDEPVRKKKKPNAILDADARIHLVSKFPQGSILEHMLNVILEANSECHLGCRHRVPFWTKMLRAILEACSECHFGCRCWVPFWKHTLGAIL